MYIVSKKACLFTMTYIGSAHYNTLLRIQPGTAKKKIHKQTLFWPDLSILKDSHPSKTTYMY